MRSIFVKPTKAILFTLYFFIILGFVVERASADLVINLNFSNTNAPADGSAILGGSSRAEAQSVVSAAARYWESAFRNSNSSLSWATAGRITQNINVGWGALGGSTLAQGGTSWSVPSGQFGIGSLTLDNDGSSQFFVDSTPGTNSEWLANTSRSGTFNGVSMNAERTSYNAPAGTARSNTDLLSVAIHEIGHALGFLSAYPLFDANNGAANNAVTITSGPFTNAVIPVASSHVNFQLLTPNGQFPYDPGGGSFIQFTYDSTVMGPSIVTGTRKLLTEVDIAILSQVLSFDMSTVDFNPSITAVPEISPFLPTTALLGGMLIVLRRRTRKKSNSQPDGPVLAR